jgi:intracellular multiplication protein IcmL
VKSAARIRDENYVAKTLHKNLWQWLSFLVGFSALSLTMNLILGYAVVWRFPVKQFLWTSDAQAVCAAIPLAEPNVSQARIKDLAANAAVSINTFDYSNYRQLINAALTQSFTPRARDLYRAALAETGIIDKVRSSFMVVSGVTAGPPNIAQEGRRDGRYFWLVEVPLRVFYRTNMETKAENRILTMTVIRVEPSPINPNGIAIDGVNSRQALTTEIAQ